MTPSGIYPALADYEISVTVMLHLRVNVELPPGGADVESDTFVRDDLLPQIRRLVRRELANDLVDDEYVIDDVSPAELSR